MFLIEAESPTGTTFINNRCWLKDEGAERQVWLNYALFMRYPRQDTVAQRLAVACLARDKVASKTRIAQAFGYHRNYVGRLAAELEEQGVEAMLAGKPGPKGPRKLHGEIRRRVCELHKQGMGLGDIAQRLREEWRIRVSRRSLGRIVRQGMAKANQDAAQASLDGAWPLALPLAWPSSTVPSPDVTMEMDQVSGEAVMKLPEVKGATDVVELPKPLVKEGKEFSGAGGFLYYPALAALGLVEAFGKVYHKLGSRYYGLREVVLALFFLWVMRFPSLEAFKGVQQRDFGCLIGARRSPAVKTLRRQVAELGEQRQGHHLMMEMARRYADGDIVEVGVLYADGHMKPYYGCRSLSEVWSPCRVYSSISLTTGRDAPSFSSPFSPKGA